MIDRTGSLLQTVLSAVHALGIPPSWKRSKTNMIYKKGETNDPSNFRPISLLSTIYKLYSGILASRLTRIATSHGWLSAEQKGFLLGIRGIQEHTFLLQTAIDQANKNHLATWRVKKDLLRGIDDQARSLLRNIARVPAATSRALFHASRRVGGLTITPLLEDADIWTVARASQLLGSDDEVVSNTAWSQLRDIITSGMGHLLQPNDDIPVDAFLSGDQNAGLYSFRHHSTRANLWTRARHAASRLHCKIDASSDIPSITVSSVPAKAVKSLRLVSRERWTANLLAAPVQGRVDKSSKDITHFMSARSSLSFNAWSH